MSGIPAWCRVGAKVVCVDDRPHCAVAHLSRGQVYTVREIAIDPGRPSGLILREVRNPIWRDGQEYGYLITRFRPLVTEQDDLEAHFNQFLKHTTDHRERA